MAAEYRTPTREQVARVLEHLRQSQQPRVECSGCGERMVVNSDGLCDECARQDAIAGDALASLYNDDEGCAWLYAHHATAVNEQVSR
jgi:hypothetical protein